LGFILAVASSRATRAPQLRIVLLAGCMLCSAVARAQRYNENAVTAASDAFGTVVGSQTIGLYTPWNARGFSPTQAENIRIEGLYFDQQTSTSDSYLFSGTDMRVGIAAQAYAFPSPSGIADLTLRTPGDTALTSVVLIRGPLDASSAEIDTQFPLVEHTLSVGLILAAVRGSDYNFSLRSSHRALSLLLRFTPTTGTQVLPFVGYLHNSESAELPYVYADGVHSLPMFDLQRLPTQSWTNFPWNQLTAGVIARVALGDFWNLRAGIFHSKDEDYRNFNDLFLGLMPNGIADHVMDVAPGRIASSYSGDLRVTHFARHGNHSRELTFALRGRSVDRSFGGDSVTDLGPVSIYQSVSLPVPPLIFSASSLDHVRQTGVGITDIERWKDLASLSLGALVTDYTRTLTTPGTAASSQHTSVLLPTISFTVNPSRTVTVYGSYTRGLEDSLFAPTSAVNRGEPPPATPTWQVDGGARFLFQPSLQLLVGGFKVHKTYFGLDTADRYTSIGDITSQGIESSATWKPGARGLTVVGGAVWLWPEVDRQVPQLGASGSVPVGPVPGTINANVDYAPGIVLGWGASLQWTWLSARVETSDDRYKLPPVGTLNVGVRYMFRVLTRPCSVRLDVGDVTNAAALTLSTVYLAVPQLRRTYTLTLAADL